MQWGLTGILPLVFKQYGAGKINHSIFNSDQQLPFQTTSIQQDSLQGHHALTSINI